MSKQTMIYKALHQSVYLEKDKNINTGTRSYLILSTLTNIDQQLNGRLKKRVVCLLTFSEERQYKIQMKQM